MEIRLKEIMDSKGMKSVELAARLGVTKQTISNMLNGRVMPSLETINKIADILEVPMWQIFANPDEIGDAPGHIIEPQQKCPYCGHDLNIKVE